MESENEFVDPIKIIYEERRVANLDKDEEIAILRACGYSIPKDESKLNEIAVKMLNFLDRLTEKERNKIKNSAKTISKIKYKNPLTYCFLVINPKPINKNESLVFQSPKLIASANVWKGAATFFKTFIKFPGNLLKNPQNFDGMFINQLVVLYKIRRGFENPKYDKSSII